MLWACEQKPQSWWTDNLNLIRICVQLLHIQADCMINGQCPHYFIANCNLPYNLSNMNGIPSRLVSTDETSLSIWFVNNYIRRCSQRCSGNVSRLFDDISTRSRLQQAVSAVVHWRLNTALEKSWELFYMVEHQFPRCVFELFLIARSKVCWMAELTNKINERLQVYFLAIAFLHLIRRIATDPFSENSIDILSALFGQITRRFYHRRNNVVSLNQAAKLMKVVANTSISTVQLIEIELCKAYLNRSLRCKDSDSDSVYCLANVYLAVLYYTTGQYQTAIDHCTLVMRSQDHSQCSSHVVQGELLPKTDENIDIVRFSCVLPARTNG